MLNVSIRDRWLIAAVALAAMLPILIALINAVSGSWVPDGDRATVATRAFDVLTFHSPLVGAFSTSTQLIGKNTYSPGPLLYWLLALPSRIPGFLALPLTMALVNAGSAAGAVVIARKHAGLVFSLFVAIGIALMSSSLPADLSIDIWAPSAPVLPFTLLIFVGWSVACGQIRLLPLAVLLASFVAQCHLAYLLPSALILVVAGTGLTANRRLASTPLGDHAPRPVRRWMIIALLVGLICWSFPMLDQLLAWTGSHGHGNLAHILDAAGSRSKTAGATAGLHAVARTVGIPSWWLRGVRSPEAKTFDIFAPLSGLTIVTTALVLLGLLAALIGGWRRRRLNIAVAAGLALALCLAVAVFTASFPNQGATIFSYSYSSWWTAPAGMWAWLVVGWATIVLVPFRRPKLRAANPIVAIVALVAVFGVSLWAGLRSRGNAVNPNEFASTRELISEVNRNVPSKSPVLVTGGSFGYDASVVFALRRKGLSVGSPSAREFGTSYTVAGRRFAQVLNIRDDATLPPGARLVGRVSTPSSPPHPVTLGLLPAP